MRCVMCPRTSNMTRSQGCMEYELFTRIIDELVAENPGYINGEPVWLHHFGESLLHPGFDVCIRYAVSRGVITCLSLNPLMLTAQASTRLLRANPAILYISLDGHDDTSFERIRGIKNAYERSLSNLQHFLALKLEMKSECRIVLSMIDFDLNQQSIEKTRSQWKSQPGVDEFLVKSFCTWDGSAKDIIQLQGGTGIKPCQSSSRVECNFPWERMTVLWDGTVVPCCNDYDGKLSLGHLHEGTLCQIWNGPEMQRLRNEFISNRITNPLCRRCEKLRLPRDQWNW